MIIRSLRVDAWTAVIWMVFIVFPLLTGCGSGGPQSPIIAQKLIRTGDEIMVCGQLYHTGTAVVLWTDPGGYDAYRTERRFVPWAQASYEQTKPQSKDIAANGPARFGIRRLSDPLEFERIRGGGWDLGTLQQCVDQFVIHYDACGLSRVCFETLQDQRGLSVHFMLDIDGTIYQTLDVKERAWHATRSNDRSIGIEIANVGAVQNVALVREWYPRDSTGRTIIAIPSRFGGGSLRLPGAVLAPVENNPVTGVIQGKLLHQYDFTPQQYAALIRLTATLCTLFPRIHCDAPRDADGRVINHVLSDNQWKNQHGLLGHYHLDSTKIDPGPAFNWDKVIQGARGLMQTANRPDDL